MREQIIEQVKKEKVIAIVRRFSPEECEKLADALYAGGIHMMEIAYDQKCPEHDAQVAASIRAIKEKYQGKMSLGAGTVMTKAQADLAAQAGAQYLISANTDPEIIRYTRELGLVSMPGAMTPSEIAQAYAAGADFVKVFPAGDLGAGYIKALSGGPYPHIPLLAVGGVSEKNAGEFLKAGALGVGIGGNLTKRELIAAGNYEEITKTARAVVEACRG